MNEIIDPNHPAFAAPASGDQPQPGIVPLGDRPKQAQSAMISVESDRAIQEIQAMLIIAKRFPRDEEEATNKVLAACARPAMAEAGLYDYAKGGNEISGPSIRLAEAMAQAWGNIEYGWRELSRVGSTSTLQAYAWDMQTNTRKPLVFDVKHVRNTRSGSYALKDEREIYENNANNAARRMRACILSLIPGDVKDRAVEVCEKTLAQQATPEIIDRMLASFSGKFGVTVPMIEEVIQCKVEAIKGSQVVRLRKIFNSLNDGMSSVSDWFEITLSDKGKGAPANNAESFKAKQEATPPKPPSAAANTLKAALAEGLIPGAKGDLDDVPAFIARDKPSTESVPVPTGDALAERKKKADQLIENLEAVETTDERSQFFTAAGGQAFIMELNRDGRYDECKQIKKLVGLA